MYKFQIGDEVIHKLGRDRYKIHSYAPPDICYVDNIYSGIKRQFCSVAWLENNCILFERPTKSHPLTSIFK